MENRGGYEQTSVITAQFVRRLNFRHHSDYCINIARVTDGISDLPPDAVSKGKGKGYVDVILTGTLLPCIPVKAQYVVAWRKSKYGTQGKVISYALLPPDSKKGIIYYLSSRQFKGIGKALASSIVDVFGDQTLEIIRNSPEQLLSVRGITRSRLSVLINGCIQAECYSRLACFLGAFDFSSDKIMDISASLGPDAVEIVQKNPYVLLDVKGIGFLAADRIALSLGNMLSSQERIEGAINHILLTDSIEKGNLWTHRVILKHEVLELLNNHLPEPAVTEERYDEAFQCMLSDKKAVAHGDCVYSLENETYESDAAVRIAELMRNPISRIKINAYQKAFLKISKNSAFPFSDDQKKAVMTVLSNRVSILTGGPGTGKTTVLKTIIESYQKVNGEKSAVTLLAPTGKAAGRMKESTGLHANTIHKECRIFDTTAKSDTQLPEGLIVVDEFSMVDQFTAWHLMKCIRSNRSHLVLVGDPDQLPSVSAGDVLNQLLGSGVIPIAKLTEIHRQQSDASAIIDNAYTINNGTGNLTYNERFTLIYAMNDEEGEQRIKDIYSRMIAEYGITNVQILCPYRRKRRLGTEMLNHELQNIVNPAGNGEASAVVNNIEYRIRDRIIQLKNTEKASNGDVGTITGISFDKDESGNEELTFTIDFGDRIVHYGRDDMLSTDLAYALTIHKSQGSRATSSHMKSMCANA